MKAIVYHQPGPAEVLTYQDMPTPVPAADEVLIKIAGIGVNFAEIGRRSGKLPLVAGETYPLIPGSEGAGTIVEVGSAVSDYKVGDKVFTRLRGSYAEFGVAKPAGMIRVPEGMSMVEAATVPIIFETAYGCLVHGGNLQKGETILIQACASGVGIALVQLAKHLGATVIGTASTDEKLEWAKGYGLDHGINYATTDFVAEVKKLTDGKGVPIIVDGVSGEVFEKSLGLLSHGGRIINYGTASGKRDVNVLLPQLFFGGLSIIGAGSNRATRADMAEAMQLFADGTFKTTLDRTFPLQEAAAAHHYIEDRKVRGKIALTVE